MSLILAPTGRDAKIAAALLQKSQTTPVICTDLKDLLHRLSDEVEMVIIADEALRSADLEPVAAWIRAQASWSDLPFIVLTRHSRNPHQEAALARISNTLGNVTFLERPFHPSTFRSVAAAALKARRRQYEARAHILELRESERRLQSALLAGRLGAWELEPETGELAASAECKAVFGHGCEDAFALRDLLAQTDPSDATRLTSLLSERGDEAEEQVLQFRNRWPDGDLHWAELRARAMRTVDGKVRLVGVASDITERKLFTEGLQRINEALEKRVAERTAALETAHRIVLQEIEQRQSTENLLRQAQKMEMIGQLTGGVAHDFNNLLMAVLGNLALLRKRVAGDAKAEHLIEGAVEGAQRGAALTQRLLAFARRQDLSVEPRNVVELVRGMADLLKSSIPAGIELRLDLAQGLPTARVDAIQVELALLNLVVNARDAMPDGGTLRVSADLAEEKKDGELSGGKYVRVSVTDTGTGMTPETLAKATNPFFSTKEVGKGTGLGLSMVHGLAQQLSGALRLYSEVGKGTRAELWLPVMERHGEARTRPENKPYVGKRATKAWILVVDDDALVASSTAALLEDLGHDVIATGSGARALEIIRDNPSLDLVITDFLMPNMTGAQLARELKQLRPGLPVLLVTGYAELSGVEEVEIPRLRKPYQQRELEAELARLLQQA